MWDVGVGEGEAESRGQMEMEMEMEMEINRCGFQHAKRSDFSVHTFFFFKFIPPVRSTEHDTRKKGPARRAFGDVIEVHGEVQPHTGMQRRQE